MTAILEPGISSPALTGSWKAPLALTALVLGWVALLYWQTLRSMVGIWARSETFAHGFLVLPVCLWLVWRQRDRLGDVVPAPSRSAAGLLLAMGLVWLLGEMAAANAASQFALVAMLALCVPALLGWPLAKRLAFPLGFLFFAVPAGEFLTPQFMAWTARFTVLGLRLSGVPVYQDGLEFVIPSGNWSVVQACSGIRYLIASVMVGTLFAYLNFRSLPRRLAFVAVSLAVPVVANWARAYLIVMIGHLSGNKLATGVDHLIYGWLFFGVVVTLMFLIAYRWAETGAPEPVPATAGAMEAAALPPWGGAGLAALAAALPLLASHGLEAVNRARPPFLDKDPAALAAGGWQPVPVEGGAWRPVLQGAAETWQQAFAKDGRRIGLHIGYYRNQDHDHKLLSSANVLVGSDDKAWLMAPLGRRQAPVGQDGLAVAAAAVRPRLGQSGAEPVLAWQWYWVGGRMTASAAAARAWGLWSRLLGQGDDAAAIVLYAPAGVGDEALADFCRSASAGLIRLLEQTRQRR